MKAWAVWNRLSVGKQNTKLVASTLWTLICGNEHSISTYKTSSRLCAV